ncbi:MAG: hypothetical protein FWD22_02200 [Treponema sp.]|nr:hypothetical protein [Treponema sp.]
MNIFHIVSIICLAVCFLMFFYLKWYIKKRTSSSMLEEHREEVNRLIVDINSVTDRNLQLVEDSITKLKTLMEDTEKRINVYNKELEKSRTGEALYTSLGRGIRAALKTPQEPAPLQAEHPLNSPQLSLELPPAAPAAPAAVVPAPAPPAAEKPAEVPAPPAKPPSKKQIRAAIDTLVNEGLSPDEIASRLDISVAEVNLAMNLRRGK